MSNILVTGGAGLIGSHLTNDLLGRGHRVVVLDDLSGRFEDTRGDSPEILNLPAYNAVLHAYSSQQKTSKVFAERALCSLDDGLRRVTHRVRQHGARSSKEFEVIETGKNFPARWLAETRLSRREIAS